MDLIFPKSLTGKYFINSLQVSAAAIAGNGQTALMRGRVLGPVADELSLYYLCEIYPATDDQIAITTETIMPLEALTGVYFYDSRQLLDAAWTGMQRDLFARRLAMEKEHRRRLTEGGKRLIALLRKHGITVISEKEAKQAAGDLVEALGVLEVVEGDD